jgi:formate hydrogenlyase subunit 3/multisubunit Na+/H+ antiporter MnhD subunit
LGVTLPPVSDPILLFLTADVVALLVLGALTGAMPVAASSFLATMLSGLGLLLCLPPLLMTTAPTDLALPVGAPGLSLHLALDPLSAFFLVIVFLAGTAIAAFQATTLKLTGISAVRMAVCCLAGTALALLAADGIALAIGLAIAGAATARDDRASFLSPLLLLTATCLLAPAGYAPRFDAIRTVPPDAGHATAAAALTIAAVAARGWTRFGERCWTRDAISAGILLPSGAYLLLRLIADLPGTAAPGWSGFVLLLGGGVVAVVQGWYAASHQDIDASVLFLIRRQAGLAAAGIGFALIARAADLPGAAGFALAATFLYTIGGGVSGVVTALAAHAMGSSAGTYRLSRLGGLVHAMPGTAAALGMGLLGLSSIPFGIGFAGLWLLFQSILSAPRTGGLLFQLPLALTGAAIALSAALATAASVRLTGIAVLGRPRTPRGAGAVETRSPSRTILLALGGISLVAGVLPGAVLWLLADPAMRALTGARAALPWVSPSTAAPGYLALPVLALVALATGAVLLGRGWQRSDAKPAGVWAGGMEPPPGLPFGEPAAQSAGQGFLPPLPAIPLPRPRRLPALPAIRPPAAITGTWLILAAFGALLLVLAVTL